MTRVERVALARKLLDDGRLSESDISKLTGRSRRWVRKIARDYPRKTEVEIIHAPSMVPNVAKRGEPSRKKPVPFRKRWRKFRKTVTTALETTGALVFLSLYVIGLIQRARRANVQE